MKMQLENSNGSASVAALLVVVTLIGISGAILTVSTRVKSEHGATIAHNKALYAAHSGVSHVANNLTAGDTADVGSAVAPVEFSDGTYYATVTDNLDGTFTVLSTGDVGRQTQTLEAVIQEQSGGVFSNAIFAGNETEDPLYELELGGLGLQADFIDGDVYSGQDVDVDGAASVTGTIRASGVIDGASGEIGVYQPIPDLNSMDYANTSDFDVAALFADSQYWAWDNAGGSAYQVPESSPAHIFRKNPTDRASDTSSTVKDDYFLEDPWEYVGVDSAQDGSNAFRLSLSGVSGEPGPDADDKVFFIDGNLWLHNRRSYSLGIQHDEPDGVQVTIVVQGNIYFGDNFFYEDPTQDGIAFIAMEDSAVADSGNIYFGDPVFGTLQQMYAFMYAENDFYDMNLDEDGSETVTLHGNMSAGNHVLIDRDYGSNHTKLTVNFDDRIAEDELEMPGLPPLSTGESVFTVVSWRKVADQ